MLFGNWNVTEDRITWDCDDNNKFEIPRASLTALKKSKENGDLYDWIMKATDQDWVSQNDLFDLNFAFVYAAAIYGADFDYDTFDTTLAEQYELLDSEEMEDDE